MKTALIVNPRSAGGATGKRWAPLQSAIETRLGSVDVSFTRHAGHAIELTRTALEAGCERIVGVGGDGTFNEIANGFFHGDTPVNAEACFGIVPMGTGGDFRRTLGIPRELDRAVEVIAAGALRTIDVGKLSYRDASGASRSRYFVNLVSFGMGGEVAARSRNILTPLGGKLAFFWATLKVFAIYRGKAVDLRLDGGPPQSFRVLNVAAGNGAYHGGGMHVCPEAILDDGLLEVTVIRDLGVLTLLKDLSYLYDGRILSHPKAHHFRASRLEATAPETTRIEVDGEPLGTLPAEITLRPRALRVLSPAR